MKPCHSCDGQNALPCTVGTMDEAVWLCAVCRDRLEASGQEVRPYILRPVPTSKADVYEGCGENPCLICGRELDMATEYRTCMTEGGGGLVHPGWEAEVGNPYEVDTLGDSYMGAFPVGAHCFRTHNLQDVACR